MICSQRTALRRLRITIRENARRTLAPDKSFGGMTLAQFEALAAPSLDARRRTDDPDNQRTQATNDRDRADEAFNARAQSSSCKLFNPLYRVQAGDC